MDQRMDLTRGAGPSRSGRASATTRVWGVREDLSLRRTEVRVSRYAADRIMGDEGRGGDGRRRRDGVDDMMVVGGSV